MYLGFNYSKSFFSELISNSSALMTISSKLSALISSNKAAPLSFEAFSWCSGDGELL
jgi:hypothetical protein